MSAFERDYGHRRQQPTNWYTDCLMRVVVAGMVLGLYWLFFRGGH